VYFIDKKTNPFFGTYSAINRR